MRTLGQGGGSEELTQEVQTFWQLLSFVARRLQLSVSQSGNPLQTACQPGHHLDSPPPLVQLKYLHLHV